MVVPGGQAGHKALLIRGLPERFGGRWMAGGEGRERRGRRLPGARHAQPRPPVAPKFSTSHGSLIACCSLKPFKLREGRWRRHFVQALVVRDAGLASVAAMDENALT